MLRDVAKAIQRGDPSSPQKAQDALERIQEMQQQQQQQQQQDDNDAPLLDNDSKPLVQAYNLWIHAIAKTVPHNPGPQAEAVLNRMLLHNNNNNNDGVVVHVEPTIVTYTSVIDAYARSEKHDGALHAERILFGLLDQQLFGGGQQLRITSVTCDAVLNAWARVGTLPAAQRALAILQRLEHLQNQQIRPTAHSYATVLNAFAKCHAPHHCQDILQNLISKAKDHNGNGNSEVVLPETVMFNVAMQAWANSGDPRAGNQAQKLLQRMIDLSSSHFPTQPDTVSYNTVISAWAHSGHVNAALQAEKVLQQMHQASRQQQQQEQEKVVTPNTISYNSVLHAYAQAPTLTSSSSLAPALRASRLLQFMIKSQNPQIAPDAISFTSVLNAWAKSKQPDKARQARHILDAFLAYRLEPNPIPFNAVLNACAFSAFDANNQASPAHTQREALRIAVSTFALLRQHCQPDTVSYGNLLKCGANLMGMGDQRTALSMKVFAQCCRDGMVGELAWNEIRRAVPRNVLMQVIPSQLRPRGLAGIQHYDLPKSWRRNVSVRNRDKPRAKKPIKPQNKKKKKKREQRPRPPIRREPRGFSEQLWTGKEM